MNAVRSWEIVDVQVDEFTEKDRAVFDREKAATAMVRIDSSKTDGTPITNLWKIKLFRDNGDWKIVWMLIK